MAKKVFTTESGEFECMSCPKQFDYIKGQKGNIIFYESEQKFPGQIFFKFCSVKTSIIERWWMNEDDFYYYVFFLTQNHFYGFRMEKTC